MPSKCFNEHNLLVDSTQFQTENSGLFENRVTIDPRHTDFILIWPTVFLMLKKIIMQLEDSFYRPQSYVYAIQSDMKAIFFTCWSEGEEGGETDDNCLYRGRTSVCDIPLPTVDRC